MLRALVLLAVSWSAACSPAADRPDPAADADAGVLEIVARGLTFDAPDEIPAGWTTVRLRNEAPMVHFALIERIPEGQGIASQQAEVAPVFQDGMNLLAAGDADAAMARFGDLPPWFSEIVFLGGPGLTAAGGVSEVTVFLEPGTYLIECYVKTGGIFHSFNPDTTAWGMVHELTVTADSTDVAAPEASMEMTVSSAEGIQWAGAPAPGTHTIAVRFADQTVHENFVGHDVHLVRMAEGLDAAVLEGWMDWSQPNGLQTPAPAEFLGGLNEMPAGSTGYLTVTLEPGEYAWIAEVPGAEAKGLLRRFRVD